MPSTHTNLLYHVVFSTKCRIPSHNKKSTRRTISLHRRNNPRRRWNVRWKLAVRSTIYIYWPSLNLSTSVSEMLARIKANSSKWANENKMKLRKFGWQEGYGAFSVSESQVQTVSNYIRGQEDHHRKQRQVGICAGS